MLCLALLSGRLFGNTTMACSSPANNHQLPNKQASSCLLEECDTLTSRRPSICVTPGRSERRGGVSITTLPPPSVWLVMRHDGTWLSAAGCRYVWWCGGACMHACVHGF
jgi:hypothetical protein